MERFNYKNLKKVFKEDASILMWLEAESYGWPADRQEEMEEMHSRLDNLGGEKWQERM